MMTFGKKKFDESRSKNYDEFRPKEQKWTNMSLWRWLKLMSLWWSNAVTAKNETKWRDSACFNKTNDDAMITMRRLNKLEQSYSLFSWWRDGCDVTASLLSRLVSPVSSHALVSPVSSHTLVSPVSSLPSEVAFYGSKARLLSRLVSRLAAWLATS
jgi:hypothetical protein